MASVGAEVFFGSLTSDGGAVFFGSLTPDGDPVFFAVAFSAVEGHASAAGTPDTTSTSRPPP